MNISSLIARIRGRFESSDADTPRRVVPTIVRAVSRASSRSSVIWVRRPLTVPTTPAMRQPRSSGLQVVRVSTDWFTSERRPCASIATRPPSPRMPSRAWSRATSWSVASLHLPKGTQEATLRVLDLSGKQLHMQVVPMEQPQLVLDTRRLAPGAYLVKISSATGVLAPEKLIVQPCPLR